VIPETRRVPLCRRADLGQGLLRRFDVDGRSIAVVAFGQQLIAVDDTCRREETRQSGEGEINEDAREIECCRHGAGSFIDNESVASPRQAYRIIALGDQVFVEVPS
jgi:nitrite reductase/ring-hydroxylating ferredoxin subunit